MLGGGTPEQIARLQAYGAHVGLAFQMADDILDYMADENELGKRLGKDLKEGKITLPVINLMKSATDKERVSVKKIVMNGHRKTGLKRLLKLFQKYNSINISLQKAQDLIDDAKAELSVFPDSTAKEALFAVADYTLQRGK